MEATLVSHKGEISLQGRPGMFPKQMNIHGERYLVPEGTSCSGGDV